MMSMNSRIFLCIILFGLAFGIGLGAALRVLPDRAAQRAMLPNGSAAAYEPDVAADRVRAAETMSVIAAANSRGVTQYVDEAQKLADSVNQHAQPQYRGADRVTIDGVAQVMVQIHNAASAMGETISPAETARRSRKFRELSL